MSELVTISGKAYVEELFAFFAANNLHMQQAASSFEKGFEILARTVPFVAVPSSPTPGKRALIADVLEELRNRDSQSHIEAESKEAPPANG